MKIRFKTLRIFFNFVAEWIQKFQFLKDHIHISKTKNRKNRNIYFSSVAEYWQIWIQKWRLLFFEGEGGRGGLHVVNQEKSSDFLNSEDYIGKLTSKYIRVQPVFVLFQRIFKYIKIDFFTIEKKEIQAILFIIIIFRFSENLFNPMRYTS